MTLESSNTPQRLLRPMQVHREYGVPKARLYAALSAGELPASDMSRPPRPGRERKPLWYIDPADLEAWLKGLRPEGQK